MCPWALCTVHRRDRNTLVFRIRNKLKCASDVKRFAVVAGECHWNWTWTQQILFINDVASLCCSCIFERTPSFSLSFSVRIQPFRIRLLENFIINYSFVHVVSLPVYVCLMNCSPSICMRRQHRELRHRFAVGTSKECNSIVRSEETIINPTGKET